MNPNQNLFCIPASVEVSARPGQFSLSCLEAHLLLRREPTPLAWTILLPMVGTPPCGT